MGMIWRLATPTVENSDKGDGSPYTWGDCANMMASMILAHHKDANSIICVNDAYGQTEFIKDDEYELRIQRAWPHPQCVHESRICLPLSTRVQGDYVQLWQQEASPDHDQGSTHWHRAVHQAGSAVLCRREMHKQFVWNFSI